MAISFFHLWDDFWKRIILIFKIRVFIFRFLDFTYLEKKALCLSNSTCSSRTNILNELATSLKGNHNFFHSCQNKSFTMVYISFGSKVIRLKTSKLISASANIKNTVVMYATNLFAILSRILFKWFEYAFYHDQILTKNSISLFRFNKMILYYLKITSIRSSRTNLILVVVKNYSF